MRQVTAVRSYSAGFMSACAFVSFMSFTQPVPSEKPAEVQRTLYSQVPTADPGPPPTATGVDQGKALAYIRIPRFGKQWLWTIAEGTDMDTLASGPGHFTGSALPGDAGNSAFAAHRSGHGDPFLDFETLRPGDKIVLMQNGAEWTYEVLFEPRIIEPDDWWVTQPHTRGGRQFKRPRLTLTTCWPKYGSEKRMYVRARLM
jgi:sortase A